MASNGIRSLHRILESEIAITKILDFLTGSHRAVDPDELLRSAGIQRHHLRKLELDDEVEQCVETRIEAIVSTPWRIEPNQTRVGKLITSLIEDHVDVLKRGVMDARFYGYSVQEIIGKRIGSTVGLERLSLKPMEWFAPQRDGSLRFFPDDYSKGIEGVAVPYYKFILSRCAASYGNPYGKALLSRLWFPVTWRREGWGMWLQFLETFGEPIVIGNVANYKDFVEAMTAQGVRSTIAWQSVTDSDKITTINASTPGEFERLESAIVRRIQKLILGQTLTSDIGSSGSYAAAAVHNDVRNDKRRADMRLVALAGQHLVNVLCYANGITQVPKFVMADDSGLELNRSQRDAVLTPVLTASGYRLSKDYFLRNYDYRVEDIEDGVAQKPEYTPQPVGDPTNQKKGGKIDRKRDLVDKNIDPVVGGK